MLLCLSLLGCSGGKGGLIETTDRMGTTVKIPKNINRIVSTAPSNTEILVGLGLADKIVAVDLFATDIEGLPTDVAAIDFQAPNIELLLGLKPDVIIAAELNRQGGNDPFSALRDAGIPVLYLPTSKTIADIYDDIAYLAEITNTTSTGEKLIKETKEKVQEIQQVTALIGSRKKVYFEIDAGYSFGRDTFINEILETAGGVNIFEDKTGWLAVGSESVISLNPDVIITTATYADDAVGQIKSRNGFSGITAVKNGDVYLIEPNNVSRPTQNVVKGMMEIAEILYPEYYEK